MPREFNRTRRVNEQLKRELAQIIQLELKDPRLGMVTVSAVETTRDLNHATVYVTVFGVDSTPQVIFLLNEAAGYLRNELARRVHMRTVPALSFVFDESIARGNHVRELIDEMNIQSENETN
ncbi:MAG TPA: 30S ribosome-binding factor RbfA [Gammaproteobacteria bacterium]|nr:30S ribosome-binding factor RbfA [Gammaproteobacteria bacterium]